MTDEQFDVVTSLMRMSSQPILVAARLVLVNGERPADAAREAGCHSNHLARDTAKIMTIHNRITAAYSK